MRKIQVWVIACASMLFLTACNSEGQVELYRTLNFSEKDESSVVVLADKEEVSIFAEAVKKAKKQPGIVDMAAPEFAFEMDEQTFYLWIGEDVGTLMNADDTHTIYSLPAKNARAVNDVVSRTFEVEE